MARKPGTVSGVYERIPGGEIWSARSGSMEAWSERASGEGRRTGRGNCLGGEGEDDKAHRRGRVAGDGQAACSDYREVAVLGDATAMTVQSYAMSSNGT